MTDAPLPEPGNCGRWPWPGVLPLCVVAGSKTPYDDLTSLVQEAKKRNPVLAIRGDLRQGLTIDYLLAASLAREGKFDWQMVKSDNYNLSILSTGEVEAIIVPLFDLQNHLQDRCLKVLVADEPDPLPYCSQGATVRQ